MQLSLRGGCQQRNDRVPQRARPLRLWQRPGNGSSLMIALNARTTIAVDLPYQIYIEVTNRCNSLCASCPLTYDHFLPFEPKHHLTWPQFRRIVDQLPRIERAVLHGIREPLLKPQPPRSGA